MRRDLDAEKLRSSDGRGVELIIRALGGAWGLSVAERRYDIFEPALYGVNQKSDETHDSYVARHDIQFEELKATGATALRISEVISSFGAVAFRRRTASTSLSNAKAS